MESQAVFGLTDGGSEIPSLYSASFHWRKTCQEADFESVSFKLVLAPLSFGDGAVLR